MKTVLIALATIATLTTTATAGQICTSAAEMQSSLIDWYGERPVTGPSQVNTRLWVSDATGSWTMVRTLADGNACVEAQGGNWTAGMDAQQMMATIQARTEG